MLKNKDIGEFKKDMLKRLNIRQNSIEDSKIDIEESELDEEDEIKPHIPNPQITIDKRKYRVYKASRTYQKRDGSRVTKLYDVKQLVKTTGMKKGRPFNPYKAQLKKILTSLSENTIKKLIDYINRLKLLDIDPNVDLYGE